MVNYARMEEVWRSYGPLEPIGPEADRAAGRRRRGAIAAGVIGVCAAGAAAGLYLKPNLESEPRRETRLADAREAERPDRLAEAEALQAELGLAVGEGSVYPASVEGPAGGPVTPTPPSTSYEPLRPEPPTVRERAAAVYRAIVSPGAPPPPRVQPPAPRVASPAPPIATAPPPPQPQPRFEPAVRQYAPPPPRYIPPPPRREIPPPEAVAPPPPLIAPPPPPRGPSFDCSTVRSAAEDMVCADPRLADLDRRMAAELMGAMAAGHNPDLLLRDQNDWLGRRDRAAPDPRAVADAYQRRIGQLRSMQ